MVAVIKTGHSLRRILNYNENKVAQGKASCIGEGNYPMEASQMGFAVKLNRLEHLARLNANVTRNSVHISLNFDPSEKGMDRAKLNAIAQDYMQRIGFGSQPYLVYEHNDAGHPHIHIVSVKVRPDGSRIDMQNIGRNQSETARLELEKKYGLIPADGTDKTGLGKGFVPALKVIYGKVDSRRAISNVLETVLPSYRYASLHELNAVLGLYNVIADRGSEHSKMYRLGGLVYRILDDKGNKIGVPLKAGNIYSKPTLASLEKRFEINKIAKLSFRNRIRNSIDSTLLRGKDITLPMLCSTLEKEGISVVLRQNTEGRLYGITYIDHRTKCVFNGSELGKPYSANGILERCPEPKNKQNLPGAKTESVSVEIETGKTFVQQSGQFMEKTLGLLLQPENTADIIPGQLRKKRKKKGKSGNR